MRGTISHHRNHIVFGFAFLAAGCSGGSSGIGGTTGSPGPPSAIMTKCLAQMWAEGPPPAGQDNHWLNMSNAHYTKVARGFYQTPTGGWWATQDFY